MEKFCCVRCHYEFTTKQDLIRHLQRKKVCDPIHSSKSRPDCVFDLKNIPRKPRATSNTEPTTSTYKNSPINNNIHISTESGNVSIKNPVHITNNYYNINPFGAEDMEHMMKNIMDYIDPEEWIRRFEKIRSVPQNKNIRTTANGEIEMYKWNLKKGGPNSEWINCEKNKAINDIVKNDILNVYNEVIDMVREGEITEKEYPMLHAILNCANVVQRYTLEELTDKNEKGHLDAEQLLRSIEKMSPNK